MEILRNRYTEFSFKVITLLSIVLLIFISIIQPPYVHDYLLYIAYSSGGIGIICHVFAFIESSYSIKSTDHANFDFGNLGALIAILCFVVFIFLNIYEDRKSLPRIESITVNPSYPTLNDLITLKCEVKDQDNDFIKYRWTIQWLDKNKKTHKDVISIKNYASWLIPDSIDKYNRFAFIVLAIADDNEQDVSDTLKILIR